MNCKLCSQDKALANSHILPEFVFKPLYDEKHRFHKISTDKFVKNSFLQKGVREHLLCHDCETILSKNEKYVSEVFNGIREVNLTNDDGAVKAAGLDYRKFKLLALSVLWRAGVSSLASFSAVSLGVHEPKLREMILSGNPGRVEEYPFILCPIIHDRELLSALILEPERVRLNGHIAYRFVFSGLVWIYIVSNHVLPSEILDASINEAGQLTMLPKNIRDLPFITAMAADLSKDRKLEC